MSNLKNVSLLSREYEKMYAELKKLNICSPSMLISNLLFVAIVSVKKNMEQLNFFECRNKVSQFYPFFSFVDINEDNKMSLILEKCYNNIVSLFQVNGSISDLEKVLGLVLEKHVNRKTTGTYYTPDDTTKYICWNSLFISILNKLNFKLRERILTSLNISNNIEFINKKDSFEEKLKIIKNNISSSDIEDIVAIVENLKIVDPTCGSGAFLISSYDCIKYINQNLLDNKLDFHFYYKNIYGIDNMSDAVELAKIRIILKTLIDDIFELDVIDTINHNVIVQDALISSDKIIKVNDKFDWSTYGDFDCIVGNPPYVEVKDKSNYSQFISKSCGNLYAYTIERACNIACEGSIVSFIVPLSFVATPRMKVVRNYLEKNSNTVYYCTFADRPGSLFAGVHQRLTIFFANIGNNEECSKFTSSYNFWYKNERQYLFKKINFIENRNKNLPKIGNVIENNIYVKIQLCDFSILKMTNKNGKYPLYISSRIGFWAKAFTNKPVSNEITVLNFDSDQDRRIAYCFINSSLFYFMWILISDCWHITSSNLLDIKFNLSTISDEQIGKLIRLSIKLEEDLERNKVKINSKQTEYEYKHKYSKRIIDDIDDIICKNVKLDNDETSYIKNYSLKYRMNKIDEMEDQI